jgi:hypothetical protein
MSDIFVSYASEDRDRITPVVRALEATGWSVSWDKTIPVGKAWRKIIETEIETCRCMVVIWSATSINKEWVYEEASEGKRRGVLAPVLIDDIRPPLGFRDIQAAELKHWDGKAVSPEFDRLVKDISRMLGTPLRIEEERQQAALEGEVTKAEPISNAPPGTLAASLKRLDDADRGRGHSRKVNSVAVSGDGRRAVSASEDRTLKVWDVRTGRELLTLSGHSEGVMAVAMSEDGQRAVSGSFDGTLKVWDLRTGRELLTRSGLSGVMAVAVSGDGRLAVSASDGEASLRVWDLKTRCELRDLRGHRDVVRSVAVSRDGLRAVSASENTLKVWDLKTGRELHTLSGHSRVVNGVAVSGDGRFAVSASDDATLKVWDLETGRELRALSGHSEWVAGVAMSGDGRRAVSASENRTLKVWDLETGAVVATFFCDGAARCCAFAGEHLIVAGDVLGRVYFLSLELAEDI